MGCARRFGREAHLNGWLGETVTPATVTQILPHLLRFAYSTSPQISVDIPVGNLSPPLPNRGRFGSAYEIGNSPVQPSFLVFFGG